MDGYTKKIVPSKLEKERIMNAMRFAELLDCVDPLTTRREIGTFLRKQWETTLNRRGFVLGLSGGIDSALVAALITEAKLPLTVMMLPDSYTPTSKSIVTARAMVEYLGLPETNVHLVDLRPMLDARCGVCPHTPCATEARMYCRGNRAARQRMIELYDLARRTGSVVCGTENLSEYYAGYFTLHGDAASDIEPIHGLTKTEVRLLACSYRGFPAEVVSQAPSANLWLGQTDEDELGFPYPALDAYIRSGGDPKMAEHLEIEPAVWAKITVRITNTEFKRREKPVWHGDR